MNEPEICSIEGDIYKEISNYQVTQCYQFTLESAERELDFTFDLLLALNEDRISDSAKTRLVSEQESWKDNTEQKCNREIETAQGRGETAGGSESSRRKLDCLAAATEQRIKELIDEVGVKPRAGNEDAPNNSETTSNSAETVRAQELAEGNHFFISNLSPQPGNTAILLIRKQGNTLTGFNGILESDGNCFRKEIQSDASVETTIHDPLAGPSEPAFSTYTDNGSWESYYRVPLEQYSVITGLNESADSVLEICTETFSENQQ